jgi:carbon-monoxide dehydrogenase medium subunit
MIPRFALARARQIDEAHDVFAAGNGDAAYIAGGTELLQVMKMGLAQFATLIDIRAIPDLHGITVDGSALRIGAATTHRDLERAWVVADHLPALAALEGHVANVRVRNQGTIGGNLAFAEPHSDPVTLLMACDARVMLAGPRRTRTLPIAEFVLGPLITAREPDEILVAIELPLLQADEAAAYEKIAFFERPAAAVAVRLRMTDDRIAEATLVVGSIGEVPQAAPDAARALVGAGAEDLGGTIPAAVLALAGLDAVPDLNGSPDYKRHLAGVLLGRAVRSAFGQAVARA